MGRDQGGAKFAKLRSLTSTMRIVDHRTDFTRSLTSHQAGDTTRRERLLLYRLRAEAARRKRTLAIVLKGLGFAEPPLGERIPWDLLRAFARWARETKYDKREYW